MCYQRDHLICMELWPSDKHRLAYMTSLLLFQYCLPLLLVLLCYLRIFLRLKRRRSHNHIVIFFQNCTISFGRLVPVRHVCVNISGLDMSRLVFGLHNICWFIRLRSGVMFYSGCLTIGAMLCCAGTHWSAAGGLREPRGLTLCF